jgi:hypothetical protein
MKYINSRDTFDIVFIRFDKFDNSGTVRSLPYDGIHCWCIYKEDIEKYITELEFWNGDRKLVRILNINKNDSIYAIDYKLAHNYVIGDSDIIPKLEVFDRKKHVMNFIKQDEKSMLKYISDMKYQILVL